LPSLVEKSYAIATKLRKIEPIASVIFSRKSLEAICVNQKATGRDLKDRIDNLAQKGAIPELLKEAAHSVRLLGNEGAHELEAEVSTDDAETLLALCDAIIGYVYEAPQLVQRIQERLAKSNQKP
jgi:DNA polymerase III gamma/tau subunit